MNHAIMPCLLFYTCYLMFSSSIVTVNNLFFSVITTGFLYSWKMVRLWSVQ